MCTNFLLSVPVVPAGSTPATQHISARCMELTGAMETRMYLVPAQQKFPLVPSKSTPWTGTYGFVALADSEAMPEFPCFVDGLNSVGLSCAALWLPGTTYAEAGSVAAGAKAVEFHDFVAWVMSQFQFVSELSTALQGLDLIGPKPGTLTYLPLHFIATDATGASVVIEMIDGKMKHYAGDDTSDGVLTNAPTYDWQRTNLASYDHLTVEGGGTSRSANAGPPVGCGLLGLPGDIMSPSRFVKATTFRKGFGLLQSGGAKWLPTPKGAGATGSTQTIVNVALSMVQMIQATPYGTAVIKPKAAGDAPKVGDWTMWQVARDHSNAVYYFSSAFNATPQQVDLSQLDFGGGSVKVTQLLSQPVLPAAGPWYNDATQSFSK
ncbi:linear amide C-N hydrolase [Pseudomonas sp. CGJS7]|uniref:linear amide C-N hydrolase n=1 Tax=Pseudomonas sp. CGJS7 TaxID=3109348 RepID=UPI003008BBE1